MKHSLLIIILTFILSGCNNETPQFDKLIYKTSTCFGTCPSYYLEISNDKTFKLFSEIVFKENTSITELELDSTKMGYFKGKLDDTTFKSLNEKIKKISAPNYKYDKERFVTCTPTITLIIKRGGDRNCYQTLNPTSDFQNNIINFLNDICSGKLEKGEKFNTEYENGCT